MSENESIQPPRSRRQILLTTFATFVADLPQFGQQN